MRNHILRRYTIGRSWSNAPILLLALTIAIGTAAPAAASTFTVSGERYCNKLWMGSFSGGGYLGFDSIDELNSGDHFGHELRTV